MLQSSSIGRCMVTAFVATNLVACQPAAPPVPSPSTPESLPEQPPVAEPFARPGNFVWLQADGPGETAWVYRAPDMTEVLVIECRLSDKTFAASLGNAFASEGVEGAAATLTLGQRTLSGPSERTVMGETPSPADRATVRLALSDEVITALRETTTINLQIGELSAYTDQTDAEMMGGFADTCALYAGQ